MIKPVSINFTGNVTIGKNAEDRRNINAALDEVPKIKRKDFVTSVKMLQASLAMNTPCYSNYAINIASFNNGYLAGTNISVTDTDTNKCVALDGVLKTFNGEPVPTSQYDKDMKCAFQTVALDTVNKAKEDSKYNTASHVDKLA